MRFNLAFLLGVALIMFWTGIACESVGQMGSCEPVTWTIVPIIFVVFSSTFAIGFLAGKG
jgi:hypothetical protein